jgi:hypothetical protein
VGVVAGPYGGFAVGNRRGFPKEAEEISFCIKPGEGDGYNVDLRFEDTSSETSVDVIDLAALPGGAWRCLTLEIGGKVREFIDKNKWDKITFQDMGRRSTFYLYGINVKVPAGVKLDSSPEEDDEEEDMDDDKEKKEDKDDKDDKDAEEEADEGDGKDTKNAEDEDVE